MFGSLHSDSRMLMSQSQNLKFARQKNKTGRKGEGRKKEMDVAGGKKRRVKERWRRGSEAKRAGERRERERGGRGDDEEEEG